MTRLQEIRERHWALPERGGSKDIAELLELVDALGAALAKPHRGLKRSCSCPDTNAHELLKEIGR